MLERCRTRLCCCDDSFPIFPNLSSPQNLLKSFPSVQISYEGTKTYVNKNILETKTLGDEVQEPADLSQSFQELRLQSLMPKAKYTVRIAAVNSKGAGLPLKWSFETEVGRPPEMKVPQRYEDSSDFISLAFESASTVNGPIRSAEKLLRSFQSVIEGILFQKLRNLFGFVISWLTLHSQE